MSDREERADALATALTELMMPLAGSRPRMVCTAATPEQVDLVGAFVKLADALRRFSAEVLTERVGAERWSQVADIFTDAALHCRQQVAIESLQIIDGSTVICRE